MATVVTTENERRKTLNHFITPAFAVQKSGTGDIGRAIGDMMAGSSGEISIIAGMYLL